LALSLRFLSLVLTFFLIFLHPSPSAAQTRRAFVAGIDSYKDKTIQKLTLATQDADDIARDLKEVGFDEKNIKLVKNSSSKSSFLSDFNKFVETIKEGDVVFFFFSGHGFGGRSADGLPENYLLFADVKSPTEFAATKGTDKKLAGAKAETAEVKIDYETIEIPQHGISEQEVLKRLQAKKPSVAIIVLDACRSLLTSKDKGIARTGTTFTFGGDAPAGFMILYSASHGQQSIEKFSDTDQRRNSLFTTVFRDYLVKPGLDLTHLAKRVQDKVSQLASSAGLEQDPEINDKIRGNDFYFIAPVGAERFELNDNACDFANDDMKDIRERPRRERLLRHLKYFAACSTAEEATQLLAVLAHGSTDATEKSLVVPTGRSINECDLLAASEQDAARPSELPGVRFERIDFAPAIAACTKAVDENPRVVRYLFNLARVYQRKAVLMSKSDPARRETERNAVFRYQDSVERGYVAAFNNLAIMYDNGEGVEADENEATRLLTKGAEQGHPMAMYNLAFRYRTGKGGLTRNFLTAQNLFVKAAEAGHVDAMVQAGLGLWTCRCTGGDFKPIRAVEYLQRAANAGSIEAKRYLGALYYLGGNAYEERDRVPDDNTQALLWWAQAAEGGDPIAQQDLAIMFEDGEGLASAQPQIAERYWRLAAYGGNVDAQVEFAERILSGRVLLKPENGPSEVVQLLKLAMTLGSSKAALRLAKIYRKGELNFAVRPEEAVKYAYRAIDLASRVGATNSTTTIHADHPLDEVSAGILLAEMAANGEAVNSRGEPLLTDDERERLERYYGRPDPDTKQVKVRSVKVWMVCGGFRNEFKTIWVWDWGREESPTEMQFRYYESQSTSCISPPVASGEKRGSKMTTARDTLKALWDAIRKDKSQTLAFADVVAAQAAAAKNSNSKSNSKSGR
jgi:hypothetical protein